MLSAGITDKYNLPCYMNSMSNYKLSMVPSSNHFVYVAGAGIPALTMLRKDTNLAFDVWIDGVHYKLSQSNPSGDLLTVLIGSAPPTISGVSQTAHDCKGCESDNNLTKYASYWSNKTSAIQSHIKMHSVQAPVETKSIESAVTDAVPNSAEIETTIEPPVPVVKLIDMTYSEGTVRTFGASAVLLGTGTNFTIDMVGGTLKAANGKSATIATFVSATRLTISPALNLSAQSYSIQYKKQSVE